MTWELFKIKLFELATLVSIVYHSTARLRFWWLRRRGRDAEVEAIVARTTQHWSHALMRGAKCRVEVEGLEHVPPTGPVVVMSNHQSAYDIPVLLGYLGRPMGFLAKRELFRIPGLSYWMRQIHCMPLNRKDIEGSARAYERFGRELKAKGLAFIVFPEGTRSRHPAGCIQAFRRGSLRLAADHGIPILPVSLDGTRLLTQGDAVTRTRNGGRLVRVRIAPPLMPGEMSGPERKRFMEQVHQTVVSNWQAIRVQWPAE